MLSEEPGAEQSHAYLDYNARVGEEGLALDVIIRPSIEVTLGTRIQHGGQLAMRNDDLELSCRSEMQKGLRREVGDGALEVSQHEAVISCRSNERREARPGNEAYAGRRRRR